ncbi:ribosome maturation factor RimM [Clostridia bacterium]|nr:ribosome maturation factor RimM [Clostridia bacterium]
MQQIKIGKITGAAGLRGEVKLYHESGDDESLSRASSLFLCPPTKDLIDQKVVQFSADQPVAQSPCPRRYTVVSLRIRGRTPIIGLAGVNDRNAAEALIGSEVFADKDTIRPTEEDAYLVSDLIGLRVIETGTGNEIGLVQGIVDNPAHDLLEVAREGKGSLLIPMADVFIKEVNLTTGLILVDAELLLQSD